MTRATRYFEGGMTLTCSRYGSPACGSWLSKGGTNAAARDGGGRGGALVVVRDVVPRRGPAARGAEVEVEAGKALAPCGVRLEAAATTMTGDRTRPWGCAGRPVRSGKTLCELVKYWG